MIKDLLENLLQYLNIKCILLENLQKFCKGGPKFEYIFLWDKEAGLNILYIIQVQRDPLAHLSHGMHLNVLPVFVAIVIR